MKLEVRHGSEGLWNRGKDHQDYRKDESRLLEFHLVWMGWDCFALFVLDRVSRFSPSWPRTFYVSHVALKLTVIDPNKLEALGSSVRRVFREPVHVD